MHVFGHMLEDYAFKTVYRLNFLEGSSCQKNVIK